MNTIDRDTLKQLLQKDTATVIFTKADGTERELKCTLHEKYLPVTEHIEANTIVKKVNVDTLSVWDIENSGWRSFRLDSVIKVKDILPIQNI